MIQIPKARLQFAISRSDTRLLLDRLCGRVAQHSACCLGRAISGMSGGYLPWGKWHPAQACLAEGHMGAVIPSVLLGKPYSFVWGCISPEEGRRGALAEEKRSCDVSDTMIST